MMGQTLALVLLLAVAAPALAAGPADEDAIRRIIAEGEAAANGGKPVEPNIQPDVMFTNIFGTMFRGRAEWDARHRFLATDLFKGGKVKQTIHRIFFVRPDVALVLVETEISGIRNLPPGGVAMAADGVLRTLGLNVFTKEAGTWVMAAWHNTDVKPPSAVR